MAIFEPTDVPFLPETVFFAEEFAGFEGFVAFEAVVRRIGFIAFLIAGLAGAVRFAACFGADLDECLDVTGDFATAFAFFTGFTGRFACCFDGFAFFAFAMMVRLF